MKAEFSTIVQDSYELPSKWQILPFDACVLMNLERKASVQKNEYKTTGLFAVVDQGSNLIAGYTDDESIVHQDDLPLILFGDHTRIFKFLDFPFAAGADGTKLFRANDKIVDPRFLYYAVLHLDIPSRGYNRHFKYLKEKMIPVPTECGEQRVIAGVLTKIQAAVEVQDKIVATLKELKATTMAKLFREGLRGDPLKQTEIGEVPESWEVFRLESICEKMNYGTSVHCGTEKSGKPVLRIPNIINEQIDVSELKYANLPDNETEKLILQDGDILFVRTNGNKQYTGRCAVYQGEPEGALFASYLIRVRLAKETVSPSFVQSFLSSVGREQITSKANPAADGKFNIDTGILKSLLVPRPAYSEQEKIIGTLQKIETKLTNAQKRARLGKQLFSSMLHQLMTGQVRVNNLKLGGLITV